MELGGDGLPRRSAAARSRRCARSGASRRAGGRSGRCGGATSSWCWTTAASPSSTRTAASPGAGTPSATLGCDDRDYAELHCHSAFSFLDGASHPEELADRAVELGYSALALTDHDNLCGALVFAHAARSVGLQPITGCELTVEDRGERLHLTLLVEDRAGYGNLCELLTPAHAGTRAPTGGRSCPSRRRRSTPCSSGRRGSCASRGCATHGVLAAPLVRGDRGARRRPRGRALRAGLRGAALGRADAPLPARRPGAGARAGRARPAARAAPRGHQRRARPRAPARAAAGRARRHPHPRHPRRVRGGAPRQPRARAEAAGRDGGAVRRPAARPCGPPSRSPSAAGSTSRATSATARPRPAAEPDRALARAHPHALRRALPGHLAAPARGGGRLERGARADRPPPALGLLPAALRGARAGPRGGARGARAGRRAPRAAARARARLERRLDRLLPHGPLARRPRGGAASRSAAS